MFKMTKPETNIIALQKIVFPCGVVLVGKIVVDNFNDIDCPLHKKNCCLIEK